MLAPCFQRIEGDCKLKRNKRKSCLLRASFYKPTLSSSFSYLVLELTSMEQLSVSSPIPGSHLILLMTLRSGYSYPHLTDETVVASPILCELSRNTAVAEWTPESWLWTALHTEKWRYSGQEGNCHWFKLWCLFIRYLHQIRAPQYYMDGENGVMYVSAIREVIVIIYSSNRSPSDIYHVWELWKSVADGHSMPLSEPFHCQVMD